MGFLEKLRHLLGDTPLQRDQEQRRKLARAWGVDESLVDVHAAAEEGEGAESPSRYDITMWVKKLNHLVGEKLPVDDAVWDDFLADARALGRGESWIQKELARSFELLTRRVVSDGVITGAEHEWLDMARERLGLSDDRAEAILRRVVSEAEAFFGHGIEGA